MKKTHVLLAVTVIVFGILASSRGALSWTPDTIGPVRGLEIKQVPGDTPPPPPEDPPPSYIFDTLVQPAITGRITSLSASPAGGYECKLGPNGGSIQLVPFKIEENPTVADLATGEGGGSVTGDGLIQLRRTLDVAGAGLFRRAPVKVILTGGQTILILALESARFNAVMSILHSAKLTGKTLTFEAAAVKGCTNAFYAADVTIN